MSKIVKNKLTKVKEKYGINSKQYEEMMYRITCMQGYQQEIIDSIKGIVPKQVPSYWYKYKELVVKDTDDEKTKESLIKIILYRVLMQKKYIRNIKRGTNL